MSTRLCIMWSVVVAQVFIQARDHPRTAGVAPSHGAARRQAVSRIYFKRRAGRSGHWDSSETLSLLLSGCGDHDRRRLCDAVFDTVDIPVGLSQVCNHGVQLCLCQLICAYLCNNYCAAQLK